MRRTAAGTVALLSAICFVATVASSDPHYLPEVQEEEAVKSFDEDVADEVRSTPAPVGKASFENFFASSQSCLISRALYRPPHFFKRSHYR